VLLHAFNVGCCISVKSPDSEYMRNDSECKWWHTRWQHVLSTCDKVLDLWGPSIRPGFWQAQSGPDCVLGR
jgi:hypothetical protein